jgi:hypothetical protein
MPIEKSPTCPRATFVAFASQLLAQGAFPSLCAMALAGCGGPPFSVVIPSDGSVNDFAPEAGEPDVPPNQYLPVRENGPGAHSDASTTQEGGAEGGKAGTPDAAATDATTDTTETPTDAAPGDAGCSGPVSESCGNCGVHSRACANGAWTNWSACSGEGVCAAAAMRACGNGGSQTCTAQCAWTACGNQTCSGSSSQACGSCGTQTRTCDPSNGTWSSWSSCAGEGVCAPNTTQSCGNGGTQSCGGNCSWSSCTRQMCAGPATQACGNCGTQTRTCDTTTGQWSSWAACTGEGPCAPNATRSCGQGGTGTQTCGGSCTWSAACTGQTCSGPSTQACGNCGMQTRTCDSTTGTWSPWSACMGEGQCSPGATQSCGTGGMQMCSGSCGWGICKGALGSACTSSSTCGSHNCVDGYCCDSTCSATCEACDVSGAVGTCSPIPSGSQPHGSRAPCAGQSTVCGGTCQGLATCTYPTSACDDGKQCTTNDTCSGGKCMGTPLQCTGAQHAIGQFCSEAVGCTYMSCEAGWLDCSGFKSAAGCTSNKNDPQTCGACDAAHNCTTCWMTGICATPTQPNTTGWTPCVDSTCFCGFTGQAGSEFVCNAE